MRRSPGGRSTRRVRGGLAVAGAVALLGAVAGGVGCTLLLDTSSNPQKCNTDDDCARFPNAACDNARRLCVPRLPYLDAGALDSDGGIAPACTLSFDNASRIPVTGPDGGLRPLPDGGP